MELSVRTAEEERVLREFQDKLTAGKQFQVWDRGQLHSTWLSWEDARDSAQSLWRSPYSYTDFDFSWSSKSSWDDKLTKYSTRSYANLLIKSPDGRYMTTSTFILEVKV
jgi:hypothetical protein